jgi:hypothetical protein
MRRTFLGMLAAGLVCMGMEGGVLGGPAPSIDVSQFPREARLVEQVVVPVPSEVFSVLDKLGKPNWSEVLRPLKGSVTPMGGKEQISLRLGMVIAEGFIAVEAENAEQVKHIGNSVRSLAKAIGVEKAVNRRAGSIVEGAEKHRWSEVRRELDLALREVREAMLELDNEPLAQLVSLGGWLRGTEALCEVVSKNFSKDGAELLRQPLLLEHFQRRLGQLPERSVANPVVVRVREGVGQLKTQIGPEEGAAYSEKKVRDVGGICRGLVGLVEGKTR